MSAMLALIRRLLLPLLIACGLSLGVVLALHRGESPAITLPGFDACALPCWAGMTPGETLYADAPRLIGEHISGATLNFERGFAQINFTMQAPGTNPIFGSIYDDRGQVGGVRLDGVIPLWLLLEQAGRPRCVSSSQALTSNARVINVYWQMGDIYLWSFTAFAATDRFHPASPAISLFILHSEDPCIQPDAQAWRGFAPLWVYAD